MKKIKYIFMTLAISLFILGCSKFEEINTNPDKSTTATPELLASYTMMKSFKLSNNSNDVFTQITLFDHHVTKMTSTPDPGQYYWSYWQYGDFSLYKYLTDLEDMVTFAEGSVQEPSYRGLALFFKAWYGFNATLQMGDVPYSEAGKAREGISKPKYDAQKDVFAYILADLKEAESYFAEDADFKGDIMYNGDASKWRKLCNAFQLRVLNLISKKVTADQKARFAEIVGAGNLLTETDNYQLAYSTNTNASHPYYDGENRRIISAVSNLVVDALKENNDRRLFYFAEPAKYKIDEGLTESDFNAYEGAPTEIAAEQLALNKDAGLYSLVNKRYTLLRDGDPKLYFTYAEQCFILAEAAEESWISGGTTKAMEYYEAGVKAILKYYMNLPSALAANLHGMAINQPYIDGYFTGNAAYKVNGSKSDRLKQIITQRWLVDFFQARDFSYKTFLRTGYPEFPLNPNTSMNPDGNNVYPKRWKYPTSELTTNPVNYQKAVDEQYGGYDGINLAPWWLQ